MCIYCRKSGICIGIQGDEHFYIKRLQRTSLVRLPPLLQKAIAYAVAFFRSDYLPKARPRRPEKAKVIQFQDFPRATSTPPKMRLCNHLTISVLQWRKNRGVEVVEKIFAYFHGAVCNWLIFRML